MDVRIVDLPAMRVAVARGFGADPEREAWAVLMHWAESAGLDPHSGRHRFFGFNDPPPKDGAAEHGYQQWMTVAAHVLTGTNQPVTIEKYGGGRFAVVRCEGLADITGCWHALGVWATDNGVRLRKTHELEELLTPDATLPEEYVFDLHLPVKR